MFVPDFNVKNAQRIYPAADLSEQISTAGMEASGTGNMKFALNGALTIGTLDGANIEIREAVGAENFFLFGLTADGGGGAARRGYRPARRARAAIPSCAERARAASAGAASPTASAGLFEPLVRALVEHDPFLVLADFRAYVECQERVAAAWRRRRRVDERVDPQRGARMGRFSSDRSIREYVREIWHVKPVKLAPVT